MRILLLGAGGQLGSDLQKAASEHAGIQLLPITRQQLDVAKVESILPFLEQTEFDVVINCTSFHQTDVCEDKMLETFLINSAAVGEMAKACRKLGKVLVHVTTDYVFDGQAAKPYTETDAVRPLNVYGVSKASGEQLIQAYHDAFYIFRVSSLFGLAGASGKGGNFVKTMITKAQAGAPLRVVADQVMSPTHTLDIARAMLAVLQARADYGIYHCSGEGACSWYEFAREIFAQLNLEADLTPIATGEFPVKAQRPAYSVLDNAKLRPYYEMKAWQDGLREYLDLIQQAEVAGA